MEAKRRKQTSAFARDQGPAVFHWDQTASTAAAHSNSNPAWDVKYVCWKKSASVVPADTALDIDVKQHQK